MRAFVNKEKLTSFKTADLSRKSPPENGGLSKMGIKKRALWLHTSSSPPVHGAL